MSIEENQDSAVRGLLGTAFAGAEPPLRDLASGSIARGDALRRRNRVLAAGGATLSVVAVLGTFALVTGATPAKHGNRTPVNQVTSAASSASSGSPSRPLPFGPILGAMDKKLDIKKRLPALLQPLLPAGITAGQQPPNGVADEGLPTGLLTGPTGTNQVTMWVGTAPASDDTVRKATCSQKGFCSIRTVDGGTVYIDDHGTTATDYARGAGFPADVVRAGTGKTVVSRTLSMVFVPNDRTEYAFSFTQNTMTAKVQYADHEPSDYMTGWDWPPKIAGAVNAYDPSGPLMSAEDFVTMLAKPGLGKLEYLIDPRTAVSQDTEAEITGTESQIAAAAQPALPSGVKADVEVYMGQQAQMTVTGPTGKNRLQWQAGPQSAQYRQQTLGETPPNVTATKRTVPGGTLLVWAEKPMDSKGPILTDSLSSYEYWFFPDDTSKQALTMTLGLSVDQTGFPGHSATDPGKTYSVNDGQYAPVQVSPDQFLAAAQSGQLATAIDETASLLKKLE